MQDRLRGRYHTFVYHHLDTRHWMGNSSIVSHSLDCCQAPARTAKTLTKRDYWGLFHGAGENSRELFCEVSS